MKEELVKDTELEFCLHDPAHCLAPGLFRSFVRGGRSSENLDVTYEHNSHTIRFTGFEPLGADDLRYLQGIVAFAGLKGIMLTKNATCEVPFQLRNQLFPPINNDMETLMVEFSTRSLLIELGMSTGGTNVAGLRNSLRRMSTVTVFVTTESNGELFEVSYHLLSYFTKRSMAEVAVALNPFLAHAILPNHSHTRIELSEIRKIKSDATRLVHQRLCGIINPGGSQHVGIEKIISYVWGEEQLSPASHRKRAQRARKALGELGAIGWKIKEYRKGYFRICRPKYKRHIV